MFKSIVKSIIFALLLLPVSVAHAGFWDDYANRNISKNIDTNPDNAGKLITFQQLKEFIKGSQNVLYNACNVKIKADIYNQYPNNIFDCASKSGKLVTGKIHYFYSNGKIEKIITNDYVLTEITVNPNNYTVTISYENEKGGFVMPISNPINAYFIALSSDTVSETPLIKLDTISKAMNSYYNTGYNQKSITMTDFLKIFLTTPDFRNEVITTYQKSGSK